MKLPKLPLLAFFFAVALTLAVLFPTVSQANLSQANNVDIDITGEYQVEGRNAGEDYQGTATITQTGETYEINWTIEDGLETYQGISIRHDDVLAVSFKDEQRSGVVLYEIQEGPKLVGEWAFMGNMMLKKETLTKDSEL